MFDFTTVPNRRGGDSIKWSGPEKELPMWIADMDFQTAPAVIEALQQKSPLGSSAMKNLRANTFKPSAIGMKPATKPRFL